MAPSITLGFRHQYVRKPWKRLERDFVASIKLELEQMVKRLNSSGVLEIVAIFPRFIRCKAPQQNFRGGFQEINLHLT